MNHTPGPWNVDGEYPEIIRGHDGEEIANIYGSSLNLISRLDNALVISATPDLLYSLEELLDHIEWRRGVAGEVAGPNDCTHRARTAIAKATGKDAA